MNEPREQGTIFTELVLEIFRVNGLLLDAGDKLARPFGLSSARWQVLGVVEHRPSPVAQVARVMGLTRQSVQQTANALERDGFIVFMTNPDHRRARLMVMTRKGHEALDGLRAYQTDWAARLGATHRFEDLRSALAVLRQLEEDLAHG